MARRFGSAAAFKASLEAHLKRLAFERGAPFSTLQLKFVIERLLARLFQIADPPWLLKGGIAMDLRFRPRARTTKDVDLAVASTAEGPPTDFPGDVRDRLQEAADVDLGDYLSFRVGTPRRELTHAPGGGARFPCQAVLVGKTYARFLIDVGGGDALVGRSERIIGEDLLSFAGIPPAAVLVISKSQQFAEKIHAYTFPWAGRLNTRTKDLVDLVLLIERGTPNAVEIRAAVQAAFSARGTHPVPERLTPPPEPWGLDFPPMAVQAGLSTTNYLEAFSILDAFWTSSALGAATDP